MSTRSPPVRSPRHQVLITPTSRKRKANPNDPTAAKTSGREVQIGSADTNTPLRPGSAHRANESLSNSRSRSRTTITDNPPTAPPKSTRLEMDHYLEDEMRGAIFCDPSFVKNFLGVNKDQWSRLQTELDRIPEDVQSALDDSITAERQLYTPILNVLQSIKGTVGTVREACGLGSLGTNFCDSHTTAIKGDDPDSHLIKPDLALFEEDDSTRRHWETLMMPIEVKVMHTYRKVAIKQLTRYARAVFAHQIHRRHLYAMVICKWEATFVRFDRSGIVHSEPIDMRDSPEEFRRAFAGLMMLDRTQFGYDPAFTTKYTSGGQLEYYIDLPTIAFPSDDTGPDPQPVFRPGDSDIGTSADSAHQAPISRQLPTRKFKVMERLCHRKSIRSRATIVLRLREVRKRERPEPGSVSAPRMTRSRRKTHREEPEWEEVPGGRDYALKLMWRDPSKPQEGETMKQLEGEYGVVQCQWYSDVLRWGANCHEPEARSCDICCDVTPAQAAVQQANNLGDLDVEVAEERDEKEPQYVEVDTHGFIGELYAQRRARIYSWTLFSTVGKLLWTADDPRQFLEAVLDAMLGYWQVVNRGILHRDISDGNVLIAEPGQGYNQRNWKLEQRSTVQEDDQQTTEVQNHPLAESRRLAQETIVKRGQDPSGLLGDFDLAATHTGLGPEFYSDGPMKGRDVDSRTHGADTEPNAKRLKRDEDSSDHSSSADDVWEQSKPNRPPATTYKNIDFRTGTPTFMSVRVLLVEVGTPYEHHFMDDLESFFWLILWCVVQHTDPASDETRGSSQPTNKALRLLRQLDRADSDFDTLARSKHSLLAGCTDGEEDVPSSIVDELEGCQNSWAKNPAIVHVIVKLGSRFCDLYVKRGRYSKCTPADEFPKLISIISEGLKLL